MLQQIRDRTTGLIAGFIVAIVVIPFAFFGIETFTGGGGDPVVAKVGDQKIYESQFRRQYEQRYQQLVQLMGEHFRADLLDQNRLRNAVLRDMTQEVVLRQYTEDVGYRADDGTLFEAIRTEPAFQRDGRFDTQAYRDALTRVGYTPDRYEAQLRDTIEMNQMREAVVDTAFVTDVEVRQAAQLYDQQRTLQYAIFDVARYRDRVTVADADVQAHYEQNKARYMAPERVKLAYVELALDALPPGPPPSQDVLKVLYEAEKAGRFTSQTERRARHILIGFGADKDAARKKAEALKAQIDGGADFAELAKAHSEDVGSKNQGGDLGWVRRGQMVKTFEDALFSLDKGQVSAPVETEFGWHLIRVDEIKPPVVRPFEDPAVQRELTELFQTRERQQRFQELSDRLEQLAFENAGALEPVAEALQLEVKTTDWFVRGGGTGIAANEDVIAAAFSPEVLQDGENSKPISLGNNHIVVIRKADYEAPRQKTLEEVADAVRAELIDEAARRKVAEEAQETLNAVRAGTEFQQIVSAKNGELRNPGAIRRDDTKVERAVVDAVFKLPRPAQGAASYGEAVLPDGSRAVLMLTAVTPPADPGATAGVLRQRLRDAIAGAEFSAYLKRVENSVGVEILRPPVAEAPSPEG
ncbi:peptidyl-prolyl cis-trans isomerase D [Fontimonas thermophila]|uniref:Periplasmic chaperone PpiD n=1 Tax=Fontimonas thermophila TaxID=1076937 RepID=A0A1I2IXQ9_9GAMM|nr:peptidyl-prolyl cis-trans isomerase D [Fontimonas thermophila]